MIARICGSCRAPICPCSLLAVVPIGALLVVVFFLAPAACQLPNADFRWFWCCLWENDSQDEGVAAGTGLTALLIKITHQNKNRGGHLPSQQLSLAVAVCLPRSPSLRSYRATAAFVNLHEPAAHRHKPGCLGDMQARSLLCPFCSLLLAPKAPI